MSEAAADFLTNKLKQRREAQQNKNGKAQKESEEVIKIIKKKEESQEFEMIPCLTIKEISINGKQMHNRTTFNVDKIKSLADNIKELKKKGHKTGLLHPIIVRRSPLKDGEFERLAGFRREQAFLHNKETSIPAIVIECDDQTARFIRTSENKEREDINPYDEVVSILEDLVLALGLTQIKEVTKLLYDYKTALSTAVRNKSAELSDKDINNIAIIEVELKKYKIKINTLIDRLIVLKLHPFIEDKIQKNEITYSHAREINKVKDDDGVELLLAYTIKNKPTTRELKAKINELTKKDKPESKLDVVQKQLSSLNRVGYKKLDTEKKSRADAVLAEISDKIATYNTIVHE